MKNCQEAKKCNCDCNDCEDGKLDHKPNRKVIYICDCPVKKQMDEEARLKLVNDKKSLGSFIKRVRESKKMTQKQLAEKIGTTQQKIGDLETGRRPMSLEKIDKILNVTKVSRTTGQDIKKVAFRQLDFIKLELTSRKPHLCELIYRISSGQINNYDASLILENFDRLRGGK